VREVVVGAIAGAARGAITGAAESGSEAVDFGQPAEEKRKSAKR
jgi:hypothetical protein